MFDASTSTGKTVELREGRSLGYAEYRNPESKPIFYFRDYLGSGLRATD